MNVFAMDDVSCPWCEATFNSSHVGPGSLIPEATPPQAGDQMLCTECAELSILEVGPLGTGRLRRADYLEYAQFAHDFPREWGSLRAILCVLPHPQSPLNG